MQKKTRDLILAAILSVILGAIIGMAAAGWGDVLTSPVDPLDVPPQDTIFSF